MLEGLAHRGSSSSQLWEAENRLQSASIQCWWDPSGTLGDKDILEQIHQRTTTINKSLERLVKKRRKRKQTKKAGTLQPWEDSKMTLLVWKIPEGREKEVKMMQKSSVLSTERTRGCVHKPNTRNFVYEYVKIWQASQRGCGVSILEGIQTWLATVLGSLV